MANTKTTAATVDTKVKEADNTKELMAKIEAQQKQIEALMAMMTGNTVAAPTDDISADEEVLVISLTPNKLNLLGEGNSILFTFDNIYEEQYIDYATLKEVVRLNRQMAKNGRFYIADERVVNKLRLKNDYKNILTPDQLKSILDVNVNTVLELYKLAPEKQKDVIVELVKDKKFSGASIDYNLLKQLGDLCGVDLANIEDATKININE